MVRPKSTFDAPKPISIARAFELIEMLNPLICHKDYSKGRVRLYISDWDWDKSDRIIKILVNRSDKDVASPIFSDPNTKSRRKVEKKDGEGLDFSSHILIKLPSSDYDDALMLMEGCSGLSAPIIIKFLNSLLSDARQLPVSDFKRPHPDGSVDKGGKPTTYKVAYYLEHVGHISDDLKADINAGKIQSIELFEKQKERHFDQEEYFIPKRKTLSLSLNEESVGLKKIYDLIPTLLKSAKENNYGAARIRFSTSSGEPRTLNLETDSKPENIYIKKESLKDFHPELESSYANFHVPLINEMKLLIENA